MRVLLQTRQQSNNFTGVRNVYMVRSILKQLKRFVCLVFRLCAEHSIKCHRTMKFVLEIAFYNVAYFRMKYQKSGPFPSRNEWLTLRLDELEGKQPITISKCSHRCLAWNWFLIFPLCECVSNGHWCVEPFTTYIRRWFFNWRLDLSI